MIPEHLSWSREERFARCGQQYLYVYEEKLVRPPGVAIVRGRAPHRSSEADMKAKIETGELLPTEAVEQVALDHVDEAFRGEVLIDGEFKGMTPKKAAQVCRDDVRKMARRHHLEIAPLIQPAAIEVRIEANFPELPVPYEGVLDLVDRRDEVRDMKTKRKSPEKAIAVDSEQLTVYWGLHSVWRGRPPKRLILDVLWVTEGGKDNHVSKPTTRTARDWATKMRRSRRVLEALEKEIFLPAPVDAWICSPRWCGYTDICPYYAGRPRPTS